MEGRRRSRQEERNGREEKKEGRRRSLRGEKNGREEEMEGRRRRNKRENPLQHGVKFFFFAFFYLYVRCQIVSGWQNTPSFCNNRT
jgi:hypothetical protein